MRAFAVIGSMNSASALMFVRRWLLAVGHGRSANGQRRTANDQSSFSFFLSLGSVGSSRAISSPAFNPLRTWTFLLSDRPLTITRLSKNFFHAFLSIFPSSSFFFFVASASALGSSFFFT